jgi:hypothetical protein
MYVEHSGLATVHNLKRETPKAGDVYIGRGQWRSELGIDGLDGVFGNPYRCGDYGSVHNMSRKQAIAQFEAYARHRCTTEREFRNRVQAIHGRRLFCFCTPLACHGDVLARIAAELNDGTFEAA